MTLRLMVVLLGVILTPIVVAQDDCPECERAHQEILSVLLNNMHDAAARGDIGAYNALNAMLHKHAFEGSRKITATTATTNAAAVPQTGAEKIAVEILDRYGITPSASGEVQAGNAGGGSGDDGKGDGQGGGDDDGKGDGQGNALVEQAAEASCNAEEGNSEECKKDVKREIFEADFLHKHFFVTLGATSSSPFALRRLTAAEIGMFETWPPPGLEGVLQTGQSTDFILTEDTTVSSYLELGYRNRWAWRLGLDDDLCGVSHWFAKGGGKKLTSAIQGDGKLGNWFRCLDKDIRVGFAFGSSDQPSASTLLGSGEVGVSIQFGIPLLAVGKETRQSINLEYVNEIITDQEFQNINDRNGWGLSYNLGFSGPTIPTGDYKDNRPYEFSLQYFEGVMDSPALVDFPGLGSVMLGDEIERLVISENGEPRFVSSDDTYQYSLDFQIPYGKYGFMTLSGTFVTGSIDPNPWVVQLGLTLPSDRILAFFAPLSGND
ncbi:MAG: hypothetical protein AAF513_01310 [Pseudomonadota bacterium]